MRNVHVAAALLGGLLALLPATGTAQISLPVPYVPDPVCALGQAAFGLNLSASKQASGTWAGTCENANTFGNASVSHLNSTFDLISGGDDIVPISGGSIEAGAELYSELTGSFLPVGSMQYAREGHSSTLLNNGTVLIVGGAATAAAAQQPELFNSLYLGFQLTSGTLNVARSALHTATLLSNGEVLIVGGLSCAPGCAVTNAAELYNPGTGKFSLTGHLALPRERHTATLLPNGKVLIAGGDSGNSAAPLNSAEVYDPASGTFSYTGVMTAPRTAAATTLLNDGRVALVGGGSGAETYDYSSGRFTALPMPKASHKDSSQPLHSVLLKDGRMLVLDVNCELFDPVHNSFSLTGSLGSYTVPSNGVLTSAGQVLVVFDQQAEIYQP